MEQIKTITFDDDTVIINGQTYKKVATETKQQAKAVELPQKTGWERAQFNDDYCCIDSGEDDGYSQFMEEYEDADDMVYSNGNYFTNNELAKNISRAMHLWLRMSRWQAENDIPTNNCGRWSIYYKGESDKICRAQSGCSWNEPFIIYFSSAEKADAAIEAFKDDLIWYFTEFKSRMDA